MLKLLTVAFIASVATFGLATGASAESPCKGEAPRAGAILHGPVLHVEDGGRLCVARGFEPDAWIEFQLADAPAELARGTLMSAAFAKDVKSLTLIIDKNPSPVVATFTYGDAAGAGERVLATRVRIEGRGESEPIGTDAQNRRVEVALFADAATRAKLQQQYGR